MNAKHANNDNANLLTFTRRFYSYQVTKYMGKWKVDPIMEAERKVRGPPHILWEPRKSVPNFLPVHVIVVEIF